MLELPLPPLWAICSLNISAWGFFSLLQEAKLYRGEHCCHFNGPTCLKSDSLMMDKCSSGHPNNTKSYFIVKRGCAARIEQSRQAIAA